MLGNPHEMRLVATAGVLAIAVAAAGGCGGDDDGEKTQEPGDGAPTTPAPTGVGKSLRLEADPGGQLQFDKRTLQADAGRVTLVMDNPAAVPHNVAIAGQGVDEKGEVVQKGGTSRVSATLAAGEYEFYCSVPGHREGGMVGTLTVE